MSYSVSGVGAGSVNGDGITVACCRLGDVQEISVTCDFRGSSCSNGRNFAAVAYGVIKSVGTETRNSVFANLDVVHLTEVDHFDVIHVKAVVGVAFTRDFVGGEGDENVGWCLVMAGITVVIEIRGERSPGGGI